jgi:hypothetical protein
MQRSVRLFIMYRVTSRLYFHLPVLFLHLYTAEIGFYNVIDLLALYGLVTMVTSGLGTALLPYLRQKNIIALAELLKAAGLLLIIVGTWVGATSLWVIVLAQIIGGCGFSVAISTDSSLLRTITTGASADLPAQVQARSQSLMFIATLVAGSLGGILFAYEAHWPFYASFIVALASACIIFLIVEPAPAGAVGVAPGVKPGRLVLDGDQLFWMRFYALSRAFTLAPFIGFLPFFFIMIGVDPFLFGAVLGLFTLSGFVAALYTGAFLKKFGLHALMFVTLASMLASMLLFGLSDWFSDHGIDYFPVGLLAIGLLGLGSGGVRPVTMGNINLAILAPPQRTTLLATMERNFGIYNGILLVVGGYLLVLWTFQTLMLALAAAYLVLMAALIASRTAAASAAAEAREPP